MKSLVHLSSSVVRLDQSGPTHLCLNADEDVVYTASVEHGSQVVSVYSLVFSTSSKRLCRLIAHLLPDALDQDENILEIVSMKALLESSQLCVITNDGRISVCPLTQMPPAGPPQELDVIGSFDDGIRAAAWSPDDELLAVVTGSEKIILFTKAFDVLSELQLDHEHFGDDQPVALGWGKRATQFHGSLGKSAALATDSVLSEHQTLDLDGLPHAYNITWRGDGAFFAITCGAGNPPTNRTRRLIKVYSRAGSLSSSSEDLSHARLCESIAWRPEGSIIASSAFDYTKKQNTIIFFERNGLQRYGFDLQDAEHVERIWALDWNCDSRLLAVGVTKRELDPQSGHPTKHVNAIQLWYRENYHWYLKHEMQADLHPTSDLNFVPYIMWHPENSLCIYFSTPAGSIEMRKFNWEFSVDPKPKPNDTGSVVVLDGFHMLLTPFRYQVVPPPMWTCQLDTSNSPSPCLNAFRIPTHAAFSTHSGILASLCPTGEVRCYVWHLPAKNLPTTHPIYIGRSSPGPATSSVYRQICVIDLGQEDNVHDVFVFTLFTEFQPGDGNRDGVHIRKFNAALRNGKSPVGSDTINEADVAIVYASAGENWWKMIPVTDDGAIFIQTSKGSLKKVYHPTRSTSPQCQTKKLEPRFPEFCPQFSYFTSSSSATDAEVPVFIGLSESGKLYINETLLTADCSSFTTDLDNLILTTFSHQLQFLSLDQNLIKSPEALVNPESRSSNSCPDIVRAIERGAVIVVGVPSSMRLVLQMPRGNLETIYPRPMVLRSICLDLLKNGKWAEAFLQCRTHKIEFNLLVDFDPPTFLAEGVPKLIEQLNSNDHFTLFLSSLKAVDVTKEIYPATQRWQRQHCFQQAQSSPLAGESKINTICEIMVNELSKRQVNYGYINSILTAMVCKKPPDYRSALSLLSMLKSEDSQKLDDAVKYIIFLSDVNELYKVALSMYDLPLVILIAQHSQKDPKEYLPFLQSLRDLDLSSRKFKIDDHLGNYNLALKHLCESSYTPFDEIQKYVTLHSLYNEALKLFPSDLEKSMALRRLQGDWLMEANNPMEAALVYMMAGEIESAVEGFQQAEAWQEMFSLISQHRHVFNEQVTARDMAERLSASGRHIEAAFVLLEHAKDLEDGVAALCQGRDFSRAILTAISADKSSLLDEIIRPRALECAQDILEEIESLEQQLSKQVQRLAELEVARSADPDAFFFTQDGEKNDALDGVDAMTEATTAFHTDYSRYTQGMNPSKRSSRHSEVTTRSGRSTARSSKARKKEAKKKASGKKGSIYEEEYLLGSLVKLATDKLSSLQHTAGALLPALVQLVPINETSAGKLFEMAQTLQSRLTELQANILTRVEVVWDERESIITESEPKPALIAPVHESKVPRPVVSNINTWRLTILD